MDINGVNMAESIGSFVESTKDKSHWCKSLWSYLIHLIGLLSINWMYDLVDWIWAIGW